METQTATNTERQTSSENARDRFIRKTRELFAKESDLDKRWNSLRPVLALPNRRSLDRQFEAGLKRAERSKSSVSVVVLDLDRLKEINDTYGHEAGDRALRAVGSTLRTTVRQHDLCARFAGDEFIVVLWDCSPENEARRVLELQTAVGAAPFEPRPGVRVSLSISAGAARFPLDGTSFDELMAAADERMYHDKAGRRSRNSGRAPVKRSEPA